MNRQLQEAKNRLSEGPQTITRHGHPAVVVMDFKEFSRQSGCEKLSTILQECPVKGWAIPRDKQVNLRRAVLFGIQSAEAGEPMK